MPNPNIAVVWMEKNKYRFYDITNKKMIGEIKNESVDKIIDLLKINYPSIDENNVKNQINDQNDFYKRILE